MNHSAKEKSELRKSRQRRQRGERGYALIALIGVMMFSLILTTATAPVLKRELQREREEEMLWRGQQIAWALRQYPAATSLRQLVNGVSVGAKKVRLLRPSALCDPMMPCEPGGNWRLLRAPDPLHKELYDAIDETARQKQIMIHPSQLGNLKAYADRSVSNMPGWEADTKLDGKIAPDSETDDGSDDKDKRPIIGVVSRKDGTMFRNYFGIDQYDHSLFFPTVPVIAGGFISPLAVGLGQGIASGPDQRCPGGGTFIDGRCWGRIDPGTIKRDPNQIPK